jgi:flagellar hook-length control protein FliK
MTPFGGFMQAHSDPLQAMACKTIGTGKAKPGLGQLIGQTSGTPPKRISASFPDSIRQMMHAAGVEQTEGNAPTLPGKPDGSPLSSVSDPLPTVIADGMDSPATELADLLAGIGTGPGGPPEAPLATDILGPIPASSNHPAGSDPVPGRTVVADMRSSVEFSGIDGGVQTDASGNKPTVKWSQPGLIMAAKQEEPAFTDGDSRGRGNGISSTDAVKPAVEQTIGATRASTAQAPPAIPTGGVGDQGNHPIDPGRILTSQVPVEASTRVATTAKAEDTEGSRAPMSVVEKSSGQSSAASDEDGTTLTNRAAHPVRHRFEAPAANETEWLKAQSSDGSKNSANDVVRAQSPADGTPRTIIVDKPSFAHVPDPVRSEPTVARNVQMAVMDQIVDKADLRSIRGRSEIQIRLKPEFLGNVQMTVSTDKEQLAVRILTDQPVVKNVIESHLHQLKSELQNQGLSVDKFDIMVNPDADQQPNRDPSSQMSKNHHFQDGRRQEREPEQMQQDDDQSTGEEEADDGGVNYFA